MADVAKEGVRQFGIYFGHLGIHIESFVRTEAWYREMFGLVSLPKRTNYKQGPFPRMSKVGQDDFYLEVYEVQGALENSFVDYELYEGVKHLGLKIKHFEQWLAYVKDRGANVVFEGYESELKRNAFVADPDLILIECIQDPAVTQEEIEAFRGVDPATVTDAKVFGISLDHIAMHVHDAEATARWYADYYGLEKVGEAYEPHPLEAPRMQLLALDDFKIEVYEVQDAKRFNHVDMEFVKGAKHIDFAIRDREGWVDYIKEHLDPDIVVEIHNPTGGAVYLNDNSGILVETNRL